MPWEDGWQTPVAAYILKSAGQEALGGRRLRVVTLLPSILGIANFSNSQI